jgi:hypothetical protein
MPDRRLWKDDVLPPTQDSERAQAGTITIGQRTFQIDGVEFPWYITPSITVHRNEDTMYEVTITLYTENVICKDNQ